MGDSKAPGRSLSESTGLRPHEASVKINRPIFALASGLKQPVVLLVASHAAEFAKPWKSEGSAALAQSRSKAARVSGRFFALASGLQKRLVALLVASRAGDLAKP